MEGPRDPTFKSYSAAQAARYAAGRSMAAPPFVYSTMLEYHAQQKGGHDLLLDVGCGTGLVIGELSSAFTKIIGVDAGAEMLAVARQKGYKTRSQHEVAFVQAEAEHIDEIEEILHGSVDLITVASAAHWFDMVLFWDAAGRVLKPGGTVAIWSGGPLYCHPSTPHAKEIEDLLTDKATTALKAYEIRGNQLAKNMYDDLPLPWDLVDDAGVQLPFSKDRYRRVEWDRDGNFTNGKTFFSRDGEGMKGGYEVSLEDLERSLSTSSVVTRYRQANPDDAGTERDVLKVIIKKIKVLLNGQQTIIVGRGLVLLLLSKAQAI